MEAGCYTINLYCDNDWAHPCEPDQKTPSAEYVGETGAECRKQAKRDGWKFHRDGCHTCPECVTAALSPKEPDSE